MGQERLGPSYFFISLVLDPLNSLLWYVPLLITQTLLSWARPWMVRVFQTRRTLPPSATLLEGIYGARVLFFVSARTNKRHHHHQCNPLSCGSKSSAYMMISFICCCRNLLVPRISAAACPKKKWKPICIRKKHAKKSYHIS